MFATHAPTRNRIARAPTASLLLRLRLAFRVRAQRRALARADARLLRDIGVTRAEAEAEANRPLWDVPANWLR